MTSFRIWKEKQDIISAMKEQYLHLKLHEHQRCSNKSKITSKFKTSNAESNCKFIGGRNLPVEFLLIL